MFADIAPRYDLLNHLLSLNLDRGWRRAAVAALAPNAGEPFLDACAGTLDLSLAVAATGARVTALDFCREMLVLGRAKARGRELRQPIPLIEGDAMRLPFASGSFAGASVAFGIRNLDDPRRGLVELARVLAPGGRLAVLAFIRPKRALVRWLYYPYFRSVLPRVGRLVSGHAQAYSYLPSSVLTFLQPDELCHTLTGPAAGLVDVAWKPLSLGTVALITGKKPHGPDPAPAHHRSTTSMKSITRSSAGLPRRAEGCSSARRTWNERKR